MRVFAFIIDDALLNPFSGLPGSLTVTRLPRLPAAGMNVRRSMLTSMMVTRPSQACGLVDTAAAMYRK